MSTSTENLACLGDSLEKIRHLLQENPDDAQRLLEEHPDLIPRIQELALLLARLQQHNRLLLSASQGR